MPDRVSATPATPPLSSAVWLSDSRRHVSERAWPGDLCSSMHTTRFRGPGPDMYKATLVILLLCSRLPHPLYRVQLPLQNFTNFLSWPLYCQRTVHLHPDPSQVHQPRQQYLAYFTMSGSGGFYKYRCKYFYTHNCDNWVYANGHACAMCLVSPHHPPSPITFFQTLTARRRPMAVMQRNPSHRRLRSHIHQQPGHVLNSSGARILQRQPRFACPRPFMAPSATR
jgi:hypothetical protein